MVGSGSMVETSEVSVRCLLLPPVSLVRVVLSSCQILREAPAGALVTPWATRAAARRQCAVARNAPVGPARSDYSGTRLGPLAAARVAVFFNCTQVVIMAFLNGVATRGRSRRLSQAGGSAAAVSSDSVRSSLWTDPG